MAQRADKEKPGRESTQPGTDGLASGFDSVDRPHDSTSGSELQRAALQYAAWGLRVFPVWGVKAGRCMCKLGAECTRPGKHPIGHLATHGWEDATTDAETIKRWWGKAPQANIGLPTGAINGLFVLDADGPEGLAELERHPALPETPISTTGNGRHVWFRHPGEEIGNRTRFLPGLDLRGDGGYVVVPPSAHKSGNVYRWQIGLNTALAPAPSWVLTPPQAPARPAPQPEAAHNDGHGAAYAQAAMRDELAQLARATEGTRNDRLNTAAYNMGQLIGAGKLDRHIIEDELLRVALAIGLGEHETLRTIASGLDAGIGQPRNNPPRPDHNTASKRNGTNPTPASEPGDQAPAAKPARRKTQTAALVAFLRGKGYEFRLNLCDDAIEVNGERITDVVRAQLRCCLRDAGLGHYLGAADDAIMAEAARNAYHPVRDYLTALTWDGNGHIAQLASHVADVNNVFGLYLRKWLIGACARAHTGAQNAVLTLDGPQGIGKSQLARWLCPLPRMFVDAGINPDERDCQLMAIRSFVWEVSELGATTRRADVEALKSFVSREQFTVRPPYGHFDLIKPHLASYIGTVNNSSGIFSDPTGSRRYWATTLTGIDWQYQQHVDLRGVWAEAQAAYRAGEAWTLTPDEARAAERFNEEFAVADPVEDLLRKHFWLDTTNTQVWTTTADILTTLQANGLNGQTVANAMRLSATLKRLGYAKTQRGAVRGYVGVSRIP